MVAMQRSVEQPAELLRLNNVEKWFGGVHALRGINLMLARGQVYHLLGETVCR